MQRKGELAPAGSPFPFCRPTTPTFRLTIGRCVSSGSSGTQPATKTACSRLNCPRLEAACSRARASLGGEPGRRAHSVTVRDQTIEPLSSREPTVALWLPEPMLSKSGPVPIGAGWGYGLKWDGFRAIVDTHTVCESAAAALCENRHSYPPRKQRMTLKPALVTSTVVRRRP